MNNVIITTKSTDPWKNLGVEEYLLNTAKVPTLYLWQNDRTVVIGRHQNAWAECDVSALEAFGGKLARRLSGGGAVYHDLGNLNFTFIMPQSVYDRARQTRVLLNAVRAVGIDAEVSGRNDLTTDGRKFSGHAFCSRHDNAYHHGTLMVASDMERLSGFLTVDASKLASKAVSSVRSRVVNLRELAPDLTIASLAEAVAQAFTAEYGECDLMTTEELPEQEVEELHQKYASWEWRFGETPRFDASFKNRFSWGGLEVQLTLNGAVVESARVFSDALDTDLPDVIAAKLSGVRYDAAGIREALGNDGESAEVGAWLAGQLG